MNASTLRPKKIKDASRKVKDIILSEEVTFKEMLQILKVVKMELSEKAILKRGF